MKYLFPTGKRYFIDLDEGKPIKKGETINEYMLGLKRLEIQLGFPSHAVNAYCATRRWWHRTIVHWRGQPSTATQRSSGGRLAYGGWPPTPWLAGRGRH